MLSFQKKLNRALDLRICRGFSFVNKNLGKEPWGVYIGEFKSILVFCFSEFYVKRRRVK